MSAWVRGLVGVLALLVLSWLTGVSDGLNRWLTDAHWRWSAAAHPTPFPPEILVIGIDDKTLQEKGRTRDWSRAEYARLLDNLRQARAVALDVIFAEADRDSSGDLALAAAMRRHGHVVIPWHDASRLGVSQESQAAVRELLERMPRTTPARAEALPPAPTHRMEPPIPPLRRAAAGLGFADVTADADGVYRAPALVRVTPDGRIVPHLTVALAAEASGTPLPDALGEVPARLRLGGRSIPLPGGILRLQPLARPVGSSADTPGSPPATVSFVDALTTPPETFAGKIVLVGETASGTTDIRPNPFSSGVRGVELNSEIIANLLRGRPPTAAPLALWWLLVLAAGAVPLWLYTALTPARATAAAIAGLAAMVGLLEGLFWIGRILPPWAPVLIGFSGGTLFMGLQRLTQEEAQKRVLRANFSRYVAPELVEAIIHDPDSAHEHGQRRRVAVLFSDIRGFTPYSEQNPPEVVVRQMREYLNEMTESVLRHQGVLDKYIGDALMALFGPFLEGEVNLSAIAVASALDMLRRLERLNKKWLDEGLPPFRIGIGIHVGEAIVGNIGTDLREQYTALGDTVNLASRLQTANKDLNTVLLISAEVREEAAAVLDEVAELGDRGMMAVKGREAAVRVYEVKGLAAALPPAGPQPA